MGPNPSDPRRLIKRALRARQLIREGAPGAPIAQGGSVGHANGSGRARRIRGRPSGRTSRPTARLFASGCSGVAQTSLVTDPLVVGPSRRRSSVWAAVTGSASRPSAPPSNAQQKVVHSIDRCCGDWACSAETIRAMSIRTAATSVALSVTLLGCAAEEDRPTVLPPAPSSSVTSPLATPSPTASASSVQVPPEATAEAAQGAAAFARFFFADPHLPRHTVVPDRAATPSATVRKPA